MKRRLRNIQAALAVIMSSMLFFTSCSEEETFDVVGSSENKVFLNTQLWSPVGVANGVVFNITKTPLEVIIQDAEKIETRIVARCTKPAETDIRVQFTYDPSLLMDSYALLPGGLTLSMDKSEVTIPKGATVSSDSIVLSIEGDLSLFDAGAYMAPIKIVSAGDALLSDMITASLIVKAAFNNIESGATSVPGAALNRSGWSATLGGADASNIFDNSNNTYSSGSALPLVLEVDMQSVQSNITGIRLQNQSRNYCMSAVNVYVKQGVSDEYILQGRASLSRPSNIQTYPQFIRFISKVDARYIKLEILSFVYSGYPVRLSEFIPYQEE
jgi:hypothetical protein